MKHFIGAALISIPLIWNIAQAQQQRKIYYPSANETACFKKIPNDRAITTGNERCKSSAYYQRISNYLEFNFSENSLGELAAHMGYNLAYTGRDLETIIPIATQVAEPTNQTAAQIYWRVKQSDKDNASPKVLVSRFFAPKIVNYSSNQGPYKAGWRKLVYLPVRSGSAAESQGKLSGIYVLFNYFANNPDQNPYSATGGDGHAISSNNQVILVAKDSTLQDQKKYRDNVFFAVYSGYVPKDSDNTEVSDNSYRLLNTLEAGFDVPADSGTRAYAIPDACAQCHGHDKEFGQAVDDVSGLVSTNPRKGVFPFVKPNYLDTDQWYDAEELDFPSVAAAAFDPVFDGGRDHGSEQYRNAMNTILTLNKQMLAEGTRVSRPEPEIGVAATDDKFQIGGVKRWIELHEADLTQARMPIERIFGDSNLDKTAPDTQFALDKLSQFCFRCHSSIKFNTFDSAYVTSNIENLQDFLGIMPLGRVLSDGDKACLNELIGNYGAKTGLEGISVKSTKRGSFKIANSCGAGTAGRLNAQIRTDVYAFHSPEIPVDYIRIMPGLTVCATSETSAAAARIMGEKRYIHIGSPDDIAKLWYQKSGGVSGNFEHRTCEIIVTRPGKLRGNDDESLAIAQALRNAGPLDWTVSVIHQQ